MHVLLKLAGGLELILLLTEFSKSLKYVSNMCMRFSIYASFDSIRASGERLKDDLHLRRLDLFCLPIKYKHNMVS